MMNTTTNWKRGAGSGNRIQRNAYAYAVAVAMTGAEGICPSCGGDMPLDAAEVDRVRPELDYRPGNVVYLCGGPRGCNQSRARLQSAGSDWTGLEDYAAAVGAASETVAVPTVSAARAWWKDRPTGDARRSRWA